MHGTALPLLVAAALVRWTAGQSPVDLAALPHRRVCTEYFTALDVCGPSNSSIEGYTGYELELFKLVASSLAARGMTEWAPGNWSFTCLLSQPNITQFSQLCDVVAAGVEVDEAQQDSQYVQFSYATYQSGRRILVYQGSGSSIWSFLEVFEQGVWLLMFGAALSVALVVMLLEAPWMRPRGGCGTAACASDGGASSRLSSGSDNQHLAGGGGGGGGSGGASSWSGFGGGVRAGGMGTAMDAWHKYLNVQWTVVGQLLRSVNQLSPGTPGGRVVVLGSAFVALIVACMYTSAYTAEITVSNLRAKVTSMDDLADLPVGIYEGDEDLFKRFGLQNEVLLPWATAQDEANMLSLLRAGTIVALVIDAPWADFQASTNCDLFEVGDVILPVDMGFMFSSDVAQAYVLNFDHAIQQLQMQGIMTQLADKFIRIQGTCPSKPSTPTSVNTQILLKDVAGLWVFVASCVGLGALWHLAAWAAVLRARQRRRRSRQQQQQQQAAMRWQQSLPGNGGLVPHSSQMQGEARGLESGAVDPVGVRGQGQGGSASGGGGGGGGGGGYIQDASTVDERILAINARMNRIAQRMEQLPTVFSATLDAQLSELCGEVAAVLLKSSQRRGGGGTQGARGLGAVDKLSHLGGLGLAAGDAHVTKGTLEEHLELITSKFTKMQDQQNLQDQQN